ncbi:molybdate ABC transporter substrate-binding protein [Roseibium sp. M-1]
MIARMFFASALIIAAALPVRAGEPLTVFAAASLREAMEQAGAAFEKETGGEVVFSFAGTGALARQVEAGAPADVFVSADAVWMDYVLEKDAVQPDSVRDIATNAIVLIGPKDSAPLELSAETLATRLGGNRLAMADPETVPAGRYGKSALETMGLWQAVSGSLAPMENVRIALASVARGDTPLGLVYKTDAAVEPGVAVLFEFPETSHPPIRYLGALTTARNHPDAEAFLEFLTGPASRDILHSLGFVTDNE